MKFKVVGKDENGDIKVEGLVNKREASFLFNYSVNDLLSAGVQFYLDEPYEAALDDEDSDHQPLRMKFPGHGGMN